MRIALISQSEHVFKSDQAHKREQKRWSFRHLSICLLPASGIQKYNVSSMDTAILFYLL